MHTTNQIRLVGEVSVEPLNTSKTSHSSRCKFSIITREKTLAGKNYDNRLSVVATGRIAKFALSHLHIGSLVMITGCARPYRYKRDNQRWDNGFYVEIERLDALANFGKNSRPAETISYNEALIMGYIATPPVEKVRSHLPVVELIVITNHNNQTTKIAESHRVIVFSEPIIRQAKHYQTGDRILLSGRYQNHSFKDAQDEWVNLYELVTTKPQRVNKKRDE